MLPLLTAQQIRDADTYTIVNEPITAIDLMERASKAFVGAFISHFPDKKKSITVYCGTGNNGGDGLAITRLLNERGYHRLEIRIIRFSDKTSPEFTANLERLGKIRVTEIHAMDALPQDDSDLLIDAMLGSGLNKPLAGDYETLVGHLNSLQKVVVAVDVPTGFFTDGEMPNDAVALTTDLAITFQQPKINFLLPESGLFIKRFEVVDIGLHPGFIDEVETPYRLIAEADVRGIIRQRHRFSNKGTNGHALIIAGKEETMGAAILAAAACAFAGAGLTTACIPQSGLTALNCYLPELMAITRNNDTLPIIDWDKFGAIAAGPGLGKDVYAFRLLKAIIKNYKKPVVFDADALNLLGEHQPLLKKLWPGSILTPHMKEFDRLFGNHSSWWQRMQTALEKAEELDVYIILKNEYTMIATPGRKLYFNGTGNAAMATGGMGDVLTGVIASLLAQQYHPEDACVAGVYIHGKAGDELALPNQLYVTLPGIIIRHLPVTMAKLRA